MALRLAMDKSRPAHPAHYEAALRHVHLTVALAMVYRDDSLDKEIKRRTAEEIIGRWRGNRGESWHPTVADLDQLFESASRWLMQTTPLKLFGEG